ncbi:MAG: glycogen/starch synthase [Candidatus Woesearchaeota archaeon]
MNQKDNKNETKKTQNSIKAEADYLFESSWEVCNKVGGIFTVVKSKTARMVEYYGRNNYFLIGPYFENNAKIHFEKLNPPEFLEKSFNQANNEGIICYFGKWIDAESEPLTILIDFSARIPQKNDLRKKMWEDYKIDSLRSNWDFDEPMMWSYSVGRLLQIIENKLENKKIVVHCHEWMAGGIILYLKKTNSKIRTVFTTHATMLGRSIAGSGGQLYENLEKIDPDKEAYSLGVQDKYLTEKACANATDIFTTVSEITSIEAEKILGRKPEVLVLNGLDMEKFPTIEETSIKHVTCREKIREFLTYYFFPHYAFDLEHSLLFFISGRFEYRNKGIDIFIKALAKLNDYLKIKNSKRTICAMFWVPMEHGGLRTEMMENKSYYQHIKNFVQWNSAELLKRITYDLILEKNITSESLFTKEFLTEGRKNILHFRRKGNPPLSTHYLINEDNNIVVKTLRDLGVDNKEDDPVKAIIYPVYLDGDDGLINLPLYDAMAGCHLGLFPSYYEPWGYTPLEGAALGVCSLTTDLSGFGRFIKPRLKDKNSGMYVLDRFQKTEDEVVQKFFEILKEYSELSHADRVEKKIDAKNLALLADWKFLIKNYIEAHNLALKK